MTKIIAVIVAIAVSLVALAAIITADLARVVRMQGRADLAALAAATATLNAGQDPCQWVQQVVAQDEGNKATCEISAQGKVRVSIDVHTKIGSRTVTAVAGVDQPPQLIEEHQPPSTSTLS